MIEERTLSKIASQQWPLSRATLYKLSELTLIHAAPANFETLLPLEYFQTAKAALCQKNLGVGMRK